MWWSTFRPFELPSLPSLNFLGGTQSTPAIIQDTNSALNVSFSSEIPGYSINAPNQILWSELLRVAGYSKGKVMLQFGTGAKIVPEKIQIIFRDIKSKPEAVTLGAITKDSVGSTLQGYASEQTSADSITYYIYTTLPPKKMEGNTMALKWSLDVADLVYYITRETASSPEEKKAFTTQLVTLIPYPHGEPLFAVEF